MIDIQQTSKSFKGIPVIQNLLLQVHAGELFGF